MNKTITTSGIGFMMTGVLLAISLVVLAAAQTADAAITSQLQVGSTGSQVTELQTYLAGDTALYPEGIVSGYFGELTKAAVNRFQARYGIAQVGQVGPITRAKINELMGSFPAGDIRAPIMSQESVSVSGTSATISWSTSEPARSRVMYGTFYPYLYATAPSVSDFSVDTGTTVTLSSLSPNTVYYYVRESVDPSGNIMWTTNKTFQTGQ